MNRSSKPKDIKVRKGLPRPIYYLGLLVILYLPTLTIRKFTDTDLAEGNRNRAKSYLVRAAKGCKDKELSGVKNPIFSFVDYQMVGEYLFIPEEVNCKGDVNNVITAQSKNLKLWPTYSYNLTTGERLCYQDARIRDIRGCFNGTWSYNFHY